jgi:Ca2+/Na+ antiporter
MSGNLAFVSVIQLLFAFVPPPSILGGWLSFVISLLLIGLLTAIVGDLASIFGCLVGLPDSITAITFVAMGTSLPDLFASKQAATMDRTADNSIGNVTGSNSVNVFLGLGLPWLIASIYWAVKVCLYVQCTIYCISEMFSFRAVRGSIHAVTPAPPPPPRYYTGVRLPCVPICLS